MMWDSEVRIRFIQIPGGYPYPFEIFFGDADETNRSAMAQQVYALLMGWA